MEALKVAALFSIAFVLCTCGDPLADERYRGEPLFRFSGQIISFEGSSQTEYNPRLSIFWSKTGRSDVSVDELLEQPSASVSVSFPAEFEVVIFSPPEQRHLADESYGLGLILIYNDVNRDGWFDPEVSGENIIGGASDQVLLYANEPMDAERSPINISLPKGFTTVWVPVLCDSYDSDVSFQNCAPNIGDSCASGEDCGDNGVCLQEINSAVYPGGYCSVKADDIDCIPSDSTVAVVDELTMRACDTDADCPREGETCLITEDETRYSCNICWPTSLPSPHIVYCSQLYNDMDTSDDTCAVEAGSACNTDADCEGDGIDAYCKQTVLGSAYPGGICSLSYNFQTTCAFSNSVSVELSASFYQKYCSSHEDCRLDEGYVCDGFYRACIPEHPIYLELASESGTSVEGFMAPLCIDGWYDAS